MINDVPGENNDQSDVKDNRFSSLSNAALGYAIGLGYEGSKDIDYESFLVNKVVSLGNLDERTIQNLELSSNTTFTDPSGNVHSEKLAHYVEAFWNNLDEKERIILEKDLKEPDNFKLKIEEFKEPEFSEQLFENEEGVNKFMEIIRDNLRKTLLISLLTGRECKYEIYKDSAGRYFCDSFPRIGDYEEVSRNINIDGELHCICMIHTHPNLTDYDSVERRFPLVDGFSYNPISEDDRSDWVGFLAHHGSRGKIEGVVSSNEHVSLMKFNALDKGLVIARADDMGVEISLEDIEILNQEGSYTEVVARHILENIMDGQYSENIDEKLSKFFGYDLYRGNLEKLEKAK